MQEFALTAETSTKLAGRGRGRGGGGGATLCVRFRVDFQETFLSPANATW